MLHLHKWKVFLISTGLALRQCSRCSKIETRLYNYDENKWEWISGNYLLGNAPIFIIAGNTKEYKEARERLDMLHLPPAIQFEFLTDAAQLMGIHKPLILFYGEWWNNIDVLASERGTSVLNQRL
jgi:hypothetical protein